MKMRSRPRSVIAAAFFAAATTPLAATAAEPPTASDVFVRHREAVLAGNAVPAEGWLFCVGRAKSDEKLGASVGFGKARMFAYDQIDKWLFGTAPWPADATLGERLAAWKRMRGGNPVALQGAQTIVEENPSPGLYLAVVAVPEAVAAAIRPGATALEGAVLAVREKPDSPSRSDSDDYPGRADDSEPRGYWEENGVQANETMVESQFL